ncbi:MAG: hypothetical protein HY537_03780 [Deltaproteobacteria bacterium]|nr:hypothetical protein [Deltaproteobacteria bacterium]
MKLYFLCVLTVLGMPAIYSDVLAAEQDYAVAMLSDVLNAIRLFKSTDKSGNASYCSGVFLEKNVAIMSGKCVKRLHQSDPSGGLSVLAIDRSDIAAIDHYMHPELTSVDRGAWQIRASFDIALVVFSKEQFSRLAIRNTHDVKVLSPSPVRESTESKTETVYFLGHGTLGSGDSSNPEVYRLSQGKSHVLKTHKGYFIAEIPKYRGSSDSANLARVEWAEIGAIVLNSKFNIVGIVSSIQTLRLSGISGEQRYAVVTSLQSEKAYELYERAINCPNGRSCAIKFANSGVQVSPIIKTGHYANWERLHCEVNLTSTTDEERGVLMHVELKGIGGDCEHYTDTFKSCSDNQCFSDKTCQRLTIQPVGFDLVIQGRSYSFGPADRVAKIALDEDVPSVSLFEPNKCLTAEFKEPAELICDDNGGKWMFLTESKTYLDGRDSCQAFGYQMPGFEDAKRIGTQLRAVYKPMWTAQKAPPEVQSQNLYALRALYPGDERRFGKMDGAEKAAVACYCPRY